MTARVDRFVVLELLTRARSTIATRGLCQRAAARDRDGRPVLDVTAARAATFSAIGALMLASAELRLSWADATPTAAVRELQIVVAGKERPIACAHADVCGFNDEATQAEVIAKLTEAIANATASLPRQRRAVAAGGAGA